MTERLLTWRLAYELELLNMVYLDVQHSIMQAILRDADTVCVLDICVRRNSKNHVFIKFSKIGAVDMFMSLNYR